MKDLTIQNIKLTDIWAYKNNPKLHNRAQVAKIRESIREFGFISPILLDENLEIIAGHGRVAAAHDMGMAEVPAIILSHLTYAQKRAYRIADNKLTELGKWSVGLLNLEFSELCNLNLDFNLEITGFETAEIDLILDGNGASDPKADAVPALTDEDRRCHRGDIWRLGRHTIVCGDALTVESYAAIMGDNRAQMVLTDPPYNVKVKNIGSMGKIKHDEFAMASGEMTSAEFTEFLTTFMRHAKEYSVNGALHYLFMDWKHVGEYLPARDVDSLATDTIIEFLNSDLSALPDVLAHTLKQIDYGGLDYIARRRLVQTLVRRAIYAPNQITFFINTGTDTLRAFMCPDYINTQNNKIDFMRNGDDLILARPVVLNKWTGSNKYSAGRGGLMTRTDNHNMIVRAFATAWRYRMAYEKHGDLEYVVKSEQTSWRSLYRYLNLAYMHPEKVNNILSGKEVYSMEEIFAIAPQHQI